MVEMLCIRLDQLVMAHRDPDQFDLCDQSDLLEFQPCLIVKFINEHNLVTVS